MNVSIIIVSYNVKDLLYKCLSSIKEHCASAEIIVVDNNSSDESVKMIGNNFYDVRYIVNKSNLGFSAANNQGISIATHDVLLLLNPDTEIIDGAIEKMLNYLSNNTIAIIGPKILNADGSIQNSILKIPNAFDIIAESFYVHRLFRRHRLHFSHSIQVNALSGAALMFKKSLIRHIGYLDENLFWMEDVDFCYRAKQVGKIFYFMEAEVKHYSGASSKTNYSITIANQIISKLKYFKKYHKYFTFYLCVPFFFLHILSRLIVFALLKSSDGENLSKYMAYKWTLRRLSQYLLQGNEDLA